MEKFIKKYNHKGIKDNGCVISEEFKTFCNDFKKAMVKVLPEDTKIVKMSVGHYDLSGFIQKGNNYYYFSYNVPRDEMPLNFNDRSAFFGVLFRTAKNTRDYTGGRNNFTSVIGLKNFLVDFII